MPGRLFSRSRFDRAWDGGLDMLNIYRFIRLLPVAALMLIAWGAQAQSFRVQCPSNTTLHPSDVSPPYGGPVTRSKTITRSDGTTYTLAYVDNGGGIKCQQI